jgi:hypothetical protein
MIRRQQEVEQFSIGAQAHQPLSHDRSIPNASVNTDRNRIVREGWPEFRETHRGRGSRIKATHRGGPSTASRYDYRPIASDVPRRPRQNVGASSGRIEAQSEVAGASPVNHFVVAQRGPYTPLPVDGEAIRIAAAPWQGELSVDAVWVNRRQIGVVLARHPYSAVLSNSKIQDRSHGWSRPSVDLRNVHGRRQARPLPRRAVNLQKSRLPADHDLVLSTALAGLDMRRECSSNVIRHRERLERSCARLEAVEHVRLRVVTS